MSAVWKHLKVSEKDAKFITSTDSERRFSTALHVFEGEGEGVVFVAMITEITKWP